MTQTQRELFWASLESAASPAYMISLQVQLLGPVDGARLRSACEDLCLRHDVLRGTISDDGEWMYLGHAGRVQLDALDLRSDSSRLLAPVLEDAASTPFDTEAGPLARWTWIRMEDERSLLVFAAHAAICDEQSALLLMQELGAFYSGHADTLPAAIPFGNFALAEQRRETLGELAANERYWKTRFEASPARLDLPFDRLRPNSRSFLCGSFAASMDRDLVLVVKTSCRELNCSLEDLLVPSFALLMHRLIRQDEAVVLLSARPDANSPEAKMIGQCTRLLPLFSRLPDAISATEHLRLSRAIVDEARQHQHFSYQGLLKRMSLVHGASLLPAVEVQIGIASLKIAAAFTGLTATAAWLPKQRLAHDLRLNVLESEEEIVFRCDYNSDLLDPDTVTRWMDAWLRLLHGYALQPDKRVDDLPLLSDAERTRMVQDWNRTQVDWGRFESLPEIFLRRTLAEPRHIALECGGTVWTNQQLRDYAIALAHRLQAHGAVPGTLVAIAVERSPEMLGAVLAVMLVGAAYLPLDPRHPRERLEAILKESGAALLLTRGTLRLSTTATILDLTNPESATISPEPLPQLTPHSLAYLIYTSGSTGSPKGVAIEHGALMNLLRSMAVRPGLSADDTMVAIAALAFDMCKPELFLPLLTGAKLVIATDEEVLDGRLLLSLLERTRATMIQATPGHWRLLIDAGWAKRGTPNELPLKAICGAEPLPRDLAQLLLERCGELWNLYGPTETTVWSAATRVLPGELSLRLSSPLANTQLYILDPRRNPVPIGVIGELYIGGAGLAREYWKRPELTAEKFVPNPFAPLGHSRKMYATGDLARFHPDGSIELLGRADFQVKINGYRIELGEIEAALTQHPTVSEAVVLAQPDSRLAAFVVANETVQNEELQAHLARRLPSYMRPSSYTLLSRLPRNANGKIDRKALVASDVPHEIPSPNQPRDAADVIESQLIDLWQTTLGLPGIAVDTSFFSLGLGSLVALRLVTRINRAFGMNLGIASLVSAPTIEALAELVRHRFEPNTSSSVIPLHTEGTLPPLFFVHGMGGNIVTFYGLSVRLGPHCPIYAIQAQSLVGREPALLRFEDMAASYIKDMRAVQPHGPYHLVGYSFGGTMALEMAQQLRAAGEEVALLGMIDSRTRKYAEAVTSVTPVQTRFQRRMTRFRGNTDQMPLSGQAGYVLQKMFTRTIRLLCVAACKLRLKRVPSFMRSTWDINHVAAANYVERPYDGRLVLFLPSEQPAPRGSEDLGWSEIFLQGVDIHQLPGDHDRIFLEPNIDRLTASLIDALARAHTQDERKCA